MVQDIFLKLTGIDGESQDATHTHEIGVLSWDWSVSQQSNMHLGSGGGAGKCTVDDLTIEHYVDRASPSLVQYCLTGEHIPEAVMVMRKAGSTPLEYLKIKIEDVLITQVKLESNKNMAIPREKIRLSFTRVKQEYVIQNAQGGSKGIVSIGYDIKTNKAT